MIKKIFKFSFFVFFLFAVFSLVTKRNNAENDVKSIANNNLNNDYDEEYYDMEGKDSYNEEDDDKYFDNEEEIKEEEYFDELDQEDDTQNTEKKDDDCVDCIPVEPFYEKSIKQYKSEYADNLKKKITSSLALRKSLGDEIKRGFVPGITSSVVSGGAVQVFGSQPVSVPSVSGSKTTSDLENLSEADLDTYLNGLSENELNDLLNTLM